MKDISPIKSLNSTSLLGQNNKQRRLQVLLTVLVVLSPLLGSMLAIYLATIGIGGGILDWCTLLLMYLLSMIGIELGFHRYFTHRSYKTDPFIEYVLAALGSMAMQGPVIWWSAIHRFHHSKTDIKGDPHSPHGGVISSELPKILRFAHAHGTWLFNLNSTHPKDWQSVVQDLYRKEEVFKVHMQYWYWAILGILLPGLIDGIISHSFRGFFLGVLWGGFVRIFIGHHAFWALNSVCHTFGGRSFKTQDESKNNFLVAIFTLGQGWHNNHHAFPASAKVGLFWWQIDLGWLILSFAERLNFVSELKQPDNEQLQQRSI
jgi:stearoyl-CoA desaturase (Delta-9 desaturase)